MKKDIGKFKTELYKYDIFKKISFNYAVKEGLSFLKLTIKIKHDINKQ